ncbi:MAG: aldehyde-activating protein [SAR86 cluster bacterium]|uniref:Aldehyde-activating protein n=1 Tax=SAR86 cluster bacterium TaxID=2030880 RepID=A0A2A5C973_9GAMM|nr:GFA family protein [Gammaproteobacteria bacterium AH-315-E17]PCJ40377.1 MAG: aldehyde-activating protein [SAR86 cluster bacterium]
MESYNGGCLCGAVRFTAKAKPIVTRACWCHLCQKLASGNATINLAFDKNAIVITGQLKDYSGVAESGNKMHRRFCPDCGVHMFSEAEERPNIIVVRAGTLDEPESVKVEALIWTSSAPSWVKLDSNLPHFEAQPPALKVNE